MGEGNLTFWELTEFKGFNSFVPEKISTFSPEIKYTYTFNQTHTSNGKIQAHATLQALCETIY